MDGREVGVAKRECQPKRRARCPQELTAAPRELARRIAATKDRDDHVAQPVAQANKHAAQAQQSADAASKDASAAAAAAGKPPPTTATPTTTQKKATSGGASSAANALGSPGEGRLAVQCPPTCSSSVKAASKQTLSVTDLILQNPEGDSGTLTIAVNGKTALVSRLDNFRDLDYHFISPIVALPGQQIELVSSGCTDACTPGMYYSGYLSTG